MWWDSRPIYFLKLNSYQPSAFSPPCNAFRLCKLFLESIEFSQNICCKDHVDHVSSNLLLDLSHSSRSSVKFDPDLFRCGHDFPKLFCFQHCWTSFFFRTFFRLYAVCSFWTWCRFAGFSWTSWVFGPGHESSHCRIRATNTAPPPVTWMEMFFGRHMTPKLNIQGLHTNSKYIHTHHTYMQKFKHTEQYIALHTYRHTRTGITFCHSGILWPLAHHCIAKVGNQGRWGGKVTDLHAPGGVRSDKDLGWRSTLKLKEPPKSRSSGFPKENTTISGGDCCLLYAQPVLFTRVFQFFSDIRKMDVELWQAGDAEHERSRASWWARNMAMSSCDKRHQLLAVDTRRIRRTELLQFYLSSFKRFTLCFPQTIWEATFTRWYQGQRWLHWIESGNCLFKCRNSLKNPWYLHLDMSQHSIRVLPVVWIGFLSMETFLFWNPASVLWP